MKVNVLEARNRLSQLVKAAQAGEEVVIANRGKPVARLVAMDVVETETHGAALLNEISPPTTPGGILKWLQENPLPAYARRSAAEIDADTEGERNAWD
jgi:prevent-host-death family protein